MIIKRNGYVIDKNLLSEETINNIKKKLTVTPKSDFIEADLDKTFKLYREIDDKMIIPRYFGQKHVMKVNNEISNSMETNVTFNGAMRDYQQDIVNKTIEQFKTNGGGILSLFCGAGKTNIAIYIACILKLKTLVIVHKSFLLDQWYERIKNFTNARIGIIRQNNVDVKNKDIVIGMLQSLSMRDYGDDIFNDIGLIIVDECHHIGAKVFTQALMKYGGKYTLGLSATPRRKDGLAKVMRWYLGDIFVNLKRTIDKNIYVKTFYYTSDNIFYQEKKRMIKGKLKPDKVKMTTNICNMEDRNDFIINLLLSVRKYDRKILVLGERRTHLKLIQKKFIDIVGDHISTSFYMGKMKPYELHDAKEASIIFGSYAMAEEGLDINGLDTLLLMTPKKDIIQSIGRILRKKLSEGDEIPMIIDIYDTLSMFSKWSYDRKIYYTDQKYNIQTLNAHGKYYLSIKEKLELKGKKMNTLDDVRREYIEDVEGEGMYEQYKENGFGDYNDDFFKEQTLDEIFYIEQYK